MVKILVRSKVDDCNNMIKYELSEDLVKNKVVLDGHIRSIDGAQVRTSRKNTLAKVVLAKQEHKLEVRTVFGILYERGGFTVLPLPRYRRRGTSHVSRLKKR